MPVRSLIIGLSSLIGLFGIPLGVSAADSDLVIAMQGPGTANWGQMVQYTVTVANNGPESAPQVQMTSSAPYDFLFEPNFSDGRCNAPYGSISCDLGLLSVGTTNLTLAFTVRPLSDSSYCSAQTVSHTVSLSFSGTDPLFGNNSATVQTSVPCPPPTECNDGIDNDRDGAVDYSAYSWGNGDFGCSSATDRDERYPEAVCQDGRDNDRDGLGDFPNDPGCSSRQDNDEFNPPSPSPSPSYFPSSYSPPPSSPPPWSSPSNPSPSLPATLLPQGSMPWMALPFPRCYNNVGSGYVEDIMIDLRCNGSKWGNGSGGGSGGGSSGGSGGSGGGGTGGRGTFACNDGRDNDGDGRTDFPADPDCFSLRDPSEDSWSNSGGNSGGGGSRGSGSSRGGGSGGRLGGETCTQKEQAVVERTSDQWEVFPGSVLRYTIIVRNTSSRCPLTNLVLINRLPPGTIVLDAGGGVFDGNAIRWNIARIDPGALRRLSYSVRVPLRFPHGKHFGGELSLDGIDGFASIHDDGAARVLHRFPKTGVDLSLMKSVFWLFLISVSLGGGVYMGGRRYCRG